MLIIFEGIDGAGKGAQIARLVAYFHQHNIRYKLHKFPTKKAKEAFAHLEGKATVPAEKLVEVFANDIIAEKKQMEKEIADGFVVVCDRYLHSTLAYQGAKCEYDALEKQLEAANALVPDIVALLDISAEEGAKRKKGQKEPDRFEKDVLFLEKVRKNYLRMERAHFLSYKYAVVDATRSQSEIFSEIITQIEPLITKQTGR